jgi:hypothetical protein
MLARAVGLEGKLTSCSAGDVLKSHLAVIALNLGDYPHAKLDLSKSPKKKQTTRMIKMECKDCGYVARTSQKWLDEVGAAHCPAHGEMAICKPGESADSDEGGDE